MAFQWPSWGDSVKKVQDRNRKKRGEDYQPGTSPQFKGVLPEVWGSFARSGENFMNYLIGQKQWQPNVQMAGPYRGATGAIPAGGSAEEKLAAATAVPPSVVGAEAASPTPESKRPLSPVWAAGQEPIIPAAGLGQFAGVLPQTSTGIRPQGGPGTGWISTPSMSTNGTAATAQQMPLAEYMAMRDRLAAGNTPDPRRLQDMRAVAQRATNEHYAAIGQRLSGLTEQARLASGRSGPGSGSEEARWRRTMERLNYVSPESQMKHREEMAKIAAAQRISTANTKNAENLPDRAKEWEAYTNTPEFAKLPDVEKEVVSKSWDVWGRLPPKEDLEAMGDTMESYIKKNPAFGVARKNLQKYKLI